MNEVEKTVSEAIVFRRSVRVFKEDSIDTERVKTCLQQAVLAPTSSNMQLWEFYHITDSHALEKLRTACFNQNAAKTARQLVVVAVRKDLWRQRALANVLNLKQLFGKKNPEEYSPREKKAVAYYEKLIPALYMDFLGILGWLKFWFFSVAGIFKPAYREVRASDMRVVAHKSAALAAQNFMLSMAAVGYDTCPMEGCDTKRVKKIIGLPSSAEISMVIACGIRNENGVYGERFRIPFEDVYRRF